MQKKDFDPKKFIDREFEQELFEELLKLEDQARILAVKDMGGGMGKSQLLHKFQYRCRTVKPRIPVSLISLDQLPDNSRLALVQEIEKDLSAFLLKFPTFTYYDTARRACDFSTIRGVVDLRGADLRGANIKAGGVIVEHADSVSGAPSPTLTPEQQAKAQELCVEAFLADLVGHCQTQPVVIMLDAYEKCDPVLRQWLLDYFLGAYCFNLDQRPPKLVVVLAGREMPDFENLWPSEDCQMIVKSVRALRKWKTGHVEECLRVHGFSYNDRQLKLFCDMIEQGVPPSQVVETMRMILPLAR